MEGRHKGGALQGGEGVHVQEDGLTGPVDHGGSQHTHQHGGLDALLGQQDDDEQTHKHGDNSQDHGAVLGAHVILDDAGGHGAEEVTHDIEGIGVAVTLGVNAHVGANADIHQHQADGGADAQPHAQRDGVNDLITDVEHAQQQEHDALHQDDAQYRLEGAGVVGVQQGGHVARHHGEEAVQAHAGSHDKGLVGQESHAHRADGGGDAGGEKYAVPQGRPGLEAGEQVRVQGDDVGHRHERGETGQNFCFHSCAVLLQVEDTFHCFLSSFIILSGQFPDNLHDTASAKSPQEGKTGFFTFEI